MFFAPYEFGILHTASETEQLQTVNLEKSIRLGFPPWKKGGEPFFQGNIEIMPTEDFDYWEGEAIAAEKDVLGYLEKVVGDGWWMRKCVEGPVGIWPPPFGCGQRTLWGSVEILRGQPVAQPETKTTRLSL